MKTNLLFNQSFGMVGSPNQTGETLTRENRIGLMSYLRRTLMLLFAVLVMSIGQMWGTVGSSYATSFHGDTYWKKNSGTGGKTIVEHRTGDSAAYHIPGTANSEKRCDLNNFPIVYTKGNSEYMHLIFHAKTRASISRLKYSIYLGSEQGAVTLTSGLPNSSGWTRYTTYASKTTSYTSARAYFYITLSSASDTVYYDDIIAYVSQSTSTDLTAPNAPGSPSATASTISWTRSRDGVSDSTGVQGTYIFKRISGSSDDLSVNQNGVYIVGDKDNTGHWEVVEHVTSPTTTSSTASLVASTRYALVHRDLAYNMSSAAYVSTPAAASCSDDTGLAYGETTVNKVYGDDAFTNTLTNSNSLSVSYSSSNTDVATVNPSTGAVTIKAAGTTTIKATWAGNATYCEDEVTYTLNVKPNAGSVTGDWDRFGGETISLSVSPSGGSSYTYQWQKWYNDQWNDISNGTSDGVTTSGATSDNLQIANCTYNNSGSYRCVVTSAEQTNETDGYQVKVYVLECYNGGTTVYNFTRTGSSQAGTLTINLSASTAYTFKVHADNDYYGNNGTINEDVSNWVLCNNSTDACTTNLTVNSGLGGTFTFSMDYSTSGSSSVEGEPEISVTYPRKRIYLDPGVWDSDGAKFAYHYFRDGGTAAWTDFLTEDDCGMYADIPQWNDVILIPARLKNTTVSPGSWDDRWNQTNNITVNSNDYVSITGWNASDFTYTTYSTPTYTISYAKGSPSASISGSKANETKTCGVDFTLPSSAVFTREGYLQTGWTTSDGGAQTHALGGSYTTNDDQTFYPVWTVQSYNLTWDLAGGTTTSAGTGIGTGVSANTTSSVAYGTSLTSPTVTKANYDFSAWSPAVASTMPAAATTYTATWTAKKYNVSTSLTDMTVSSGTTGSNAATYGTDYSVTLAGATGYNLPATVTVTIGGNTATLTTDYTWNSSTGVLTVLGAKVTGNISITATGVAKTYSITLDDNGGSADGGATATYLSTSLSSISAPTYSGHEVDGYYTSANCTTKVATGAGALQASITVDEVAWTNSSSQWIKDGTAKFYAHWKCNTPTITDNGDNTVSITVPSGTTVRYTTDGTTPTSSTGTVYSDAFDIDEDVTVKAIAYQSGCTDSEVASADCEYTATYTVTYAYNGATGGDGTESATAASVTLPSPTKTGYTFDGWYTTAGTEVGDGGDTYNPTADITLYARWTETCSGGGGGGGSTTKEVYFCKSTDNPGTQSSIFTGAPTDGGNLDPANQSFTVDEVNYGPLTRRTSNTTHSISFTLASDKTARLWAVHNQSGRHFTLVGSSSGTIDRVTSSTGFSTESSVYADVFDITSAETYTLSNSENIGLICLILKVTDAGGSSECHKVLYHGNGAESGYIYDPNVYDDGDDPEVLGNTTGTNGVAFVKDGYTFQGWATTDDGDVAYSAGDNIEDIADDVDLYAIWAEVVPCTAAPTVTAGSNSSVTSTTATVTCADGISSLGTGGCTITSYGFVIGTSANPTLSDTQHEVGTSYASTGTLFSKNLTGLTANTTYYVRPYATNGYGTAYGTQTSFTTLATYTVTYAGNGNTDGSEPSDASSPYESGSTVKVKDEGTLVKTDYVFAGWNTAADGSGTWYCPNASFTISANTTLNAQWVEAADIECATLYTVTNIAPKAAGTLNSTGGYFSGISSNGMFTALGDVSKEDKAGGAPEMKTISSTTVGGTAFTSAIYLKRAANISSYLPTSHAIKFEIPSAGILDLYVKRSDRLLFIKSGSSTPISVGSSDQDIKESIAVTAGTWYLYANNTNTALYGMKLTCCTDPGLAYATDEVSKTVGDADFTNTLTNTYGVTVSYESSDEDVATVASDGEVTIVGAGTCTITASAEAQTVSTVDYCADDASYTLTVSLPTYTVTYNTNDKTSGSAPSDASSPYESGSTVTVLDNTGSLVRTGYVFLGWSTSYGGGTAYAPGETFTITGNTNLYPIWAEGTSATITYALNVGTSAGTEIKSSATADNANITDIDIDQTNDGANGAGASSRTTVLAIKTGANGADWSEDPTKYEIFEYTVADGYVFTPSDVTIKIANKGSSSANNIKYKAVLSDGTHSISTTYICTTGDGTVETFHMYNKSAVAFEGDVTLKLWAWTIADKSSGGDGFRMGTPLTITGAVLSTGYIISFAGNGETSGSTASVTGITSGSDVNQITANGFTKNGYTFDGWKTNTALTYVAYGDEDIEANRVDVAVNGSVPDKAKIKNVTSNITLTAQWTPNDYTITYNLNGASWAGGYSAPANYTVGTGATLPVAGNMTNTGYTFVGWYDNSSLTGSAVTTISTSDYGNKEFWAKWTENTYTITYNANGDGAGNVGDATGSTAATEGHYVTVASCGFELDGYLFAGWNTESDGTGESYGAGEDIELTANMTLYAQWAEDYIITWGNVQIGGAGATVTPNLGGGNYTITANTGSWTGSLDASMISSETSGVTITNVTVNNGGSPKTITVTFAVGAEVVGESIGLTLSVPAAGVYGAQSDTHPIAIDRCTGSGGGSDGVLFSAEFKDSGLGTSNICDAANTAYTFTTAELKSAATGGTIKAFTTNALNHMKFATNAISIAGSDGVIRIDLDNPIAENDLFTYLNVNSSTSAAYLRHTSPTTTTDQIALTVYNSKEAKVRLTSGFADKTTLYLVRNNSDFKLHKAAVVRPAFLMLLRDDTPTSDTNLEGTDAELTTLNYLTTIQGGNAYYTSPSSGNLKIKRSSSKNYIQFNSQAGYLKIVLDDALQEGDVIGFDSYNTNNLAFTATATRSTDIVTTNQLYTVNASSALKGKTTFYIWNYSGSSDYLRGLQIARSGAAGGGGGTDKITTTLSWDPALESDDDWDGTNSRLAKETGDADFTFTVTQDKNSLGALTYSSSNTGVATVTAGGTVHIVGAAGDATITATMAESGCYKGATISYNINVVDNCDDTPGHVMAYDLGCEGTRLFAVLYGGMNPEDVSFQWYRDGVSLGDGYRAQQCTVTVAGEYYVVVDNTEAGVGHCAMASDNTVEVEARAGISAETIVDQWYVKNGRRTPDVELVQTTGATGFIVKIGDTPIWNSDGSVTTGFGGCGFRLGENGIIYLNGTKDNGDAPSGLTGDGETEILKITAKGCSSDADELSITIHKQVPGLGARPSVAFVVDGTEKGTFAQADADHSTNSALYQFLDYTLSGGSGQFDLTAQNIYSSVDEKQLREHYSQFDAIIITDDPSTGKKKDGKSYVNAFGTMIDVRPILTMEAFVSKLDNWKAKGINGNPESPSPRQYAMTLQCKDHEIFRGLSVGPNVQEEEIDGVDYWTVTMVDKTKSPYSSKASDTDDTEGTPALQGFSASDVSGLLLLGEIKNGEKTMYAGVERQEEPAARLMLLGIQNKALPNALTTEGKTIIENAVEYLLKTNMEEVDDCSNYFTGAIDQAWEKDGNWFKGKTPNSPMMRVRILAPCEVSTTVHAAHIDIVTSGESGKKGGEMTGQLTIKPNGAVIVGGEVRAAEAPYFNKSDLRPTEEKDLKIETSADGQGSLILNNDAGDTKATVEYFSLGRKDGGAYQFQYFASPMGSLEINPAFAGAGIYTYAWNEAVADGWERRGYYTDVLGFEGLAITTKRDYNSTYILEGALASTEDVDIPLTYTDAGAGGQNLIGNSWTAPINIASLVDAFEDDANVVKTVNIYNSGNDEYPGLGAAGTWTEVPISVAEWPEWSGLKVIPAMQAFRIDVTSETKLTMNYEKMVRETESSSLNEPLKAPSRRSNANGASLMRIRLESGWAYTDLFLIEGGQFSEAFDNGYEAKFIAGEENTVQFYAMNGEEKMAVLATDELEGTPVGFVPGKRTDYIISFSGEGMGYYFNDVKTQTSTLISEENTYTFEYEAGDDANRFYISATPFAAPSVATGVTNLDAAAPKVMKVIYNDKLYIIRGGKVFSADGQLVK